MKQSLPREALGAAFDPQALISKARQGPLRQGEVHALSIHVSGLERALAHKTQATINAAKGAEVRLSLNEDMSALLVIFPGAHEHAVALPLDRPDIAMDFIVKALSERRRSLANPHFIGSGGAPTKADLVALRKASSKAPRKVDNPSLEDLGL